MTAFALAAFAGCILEYLFTRERITEEDISDVSCHTRRITMKKFTALFMAGLMIVGLTACGNTSESNSMSGNQADTEITAGNTDDEENVSAETTYTISYNMNSGNTGDMPEYQFLSGNFKSILNYDSRIYVDVTLSLNGAGAYSLESDCYVVESGKRAEVGDETGIGQTCITTAAGNYVENSDGTVTISVPDQATHELVTDTYSSQMKEPVGVKHWRKLRGWEMG